MIVLTEAESGEQLLVHAGGFFVACSPALACRRFHLDRSWVPASAKAAICGIASEGGRDVYGRVWILVRESVGEIQRALPDYLPLPGSFVG